MGVSDKKPRKVVGTQAFSIIERTKAGLIERLHLRIEIDILDHKNGRVLVFSVPSRPIGMPVQYKGAYWMRGGQDLIPMTPAGSRLKELRDVLPTLSHDQVQKLIGEMKREGTIHVVGRTRGALWYPGPE